MTTLSEYLLAVYQDHYARDGRAAEHLSIELDERDLDDWIDMARALEAEVARLTAALAVLDEYAAAHADYDAPPPMPKGGKHETPVIRWQARAVDRRERVAQADRRFAALLAERAALKGTPGQGEGQ